MKDKYYVPDITEFYIGFEYEEKYKDTKNDFYKLEFESIEDKVIIGEIYDSTKGLLYAELLKIDTFEVQELLNKYNYLRSSDGFNTTFYERRGGLFLKSYYRIENPRMDSVTLTLKQDGIIFDTTFYRVKDTAKINQRKREKEKDKSNEIDEDLTKEEIQKRLRKKKKEDKEKVKKGYSEFTKQYTRDYKFMKDSSVGYLKIRGFMGGPYEGLYDEFFEELDSAGTETLIIDLRDNLGGRLAEIHYLMKYLAKEKFTSIQPMESKTATPRTNALWSSNNGPLLILIKSIFTPFMYGYERATSKKKNGIYYHNMGSTKPGEPFENNFKGNIYVIVNGNSFSASSILSTNLQGSERATIVGEETGGTYNGTVAGMFKPVKLPNTKIMMQFGLGMIRAPYTEDPDGFGVIPDYTILPTIDHRKKGIDTELEWILKKVKEDKAKAELEEKNKKEEVDEEIEEVEEENENEKE